MNKRKGNILSTALDTYTPKKRKGNIINTTNHSNQGGLLGGAGYLLGKAGTNLASIGEGITDLVVGGTLDLIGFISGGMMSGVSQGARNAMNYSRGQRISTAGNTQTFLHYCGDQRIHERIQNHRRGDGKIQKRADREDQRGLKSEPM